MLWSGMHVEARDSILVRVYTPGRKRMVALVNWCISISHQQVPCEDMPFYTDYFTVPYPDQAPHEQIVLFVILVRVYTPVGKKENGRIALEVNWCISISTFYPIFFYRFLSRLCHSIQTISMSLILCLRLTWLPFLILLLVCLAGCMYTSLIDYLSQVLWRIGG